MTRIRPLGPFHIVETRAPDGRWAPAPVSSLTASWLDRFATAAPGVSKIRRRRPPPR